MQVLYALLRALSFCLSFFSGKLARIKPNFASLLKYKIQDVTPTAFLLFPGRGVRGVRSVLAATRRR